MVTAGVAPSELPPVRDLYCGVHHRIADTSFDQVLGTRVQIAAEDRHGNGANTVTLERTNLYGHDAGRLGCDLTRRIAGNLGVLSGVTVGAGETGQTVKRIAKDQAVVLDSLKTLTNYLRDLWLLAKIVFVLPQRVYEELTPESLAVVCYG